MSAGGESASGCGRVGGSLFFGVFFAAGCWMLYSFVFQPFWGVYRASSWQPTPCVIVSSKLEENQGDDSTSYRIDITYKYEVAGREYRSDRFQFFGLASNTGVAGKREIVRNHPPGKKTTCFVDPRNPTEAVIERGLTWDMLWGFFALPFFLVGAGGLAFTWGLVKWKSRAPGQAEWMPTVKHRRHTSEWAAASAGGGGPVTLKASVSPVTKLLAALLFAGIWNGVVSVVVFNLVDGIAKGRTDWVLVLFAVVFGGVGLVLIGVLIHTFLGLFTPRPILTVNTAHIPLGEMLEVGWRFRGQTGSIRRLHIYLEGREEATYRRGTRTYTDKEVFTTMTLVDTADPLEMPQGKTQLAIPADAMHSFDAGHNDIVWSLHVKGEIVRWPDVSEEYTLLLVPPGMETAADDSDNN